MRGRDPPAEEKGPHSSFTQEEWAAREEARQLLENILNRQVEIFAEQRNAILKESIGGSVALRKGCGNRARPPRGGADAEDGRIQLSANLADHQPPFEDKSQAREENPREIPQESGNVDENPAA